MRVLLAPDKFRGTFSATEVCRHLARGLLDISAEIDVESVPMADGGEGTQEVLIRAKGGTVTRIVARGPLDEEIVADYAVMPDGTAIIESARFCGLDLVPVHRRNPARTTSYGLGQAIAAALDAGVRRILIGLGGSATIDGGAGMARALGFRFEDSDGQQAGVHTERLVSVARLDASMAHPGLALARFTALCDVDNPPVGPRGAAAVFGPQKGASPGAIVQLEAGLFSMVKAMALWKGCPADTLSSLPFGGAAGGLGLGCEVFLGADLVPGSIFLMETLGLAEKIERADLVVTGEGAFDSQTHRGKAAAAVLQAARVGGKPVVVVAGSWDGSLPVESDGSIKVLTPHDLAGKPDSLSEEGLVELGRRIATDGLRLAKPALR